MDSLKQKDMDEITKSESGDTPAEDVNGVGDHEDSETVMEASTGRDKNEISDHQDGEAVEPKVDTPSDVSEPHPDTEKICENVYMKAYDLSNGFLSAVSVPILGFQLDGIWHTSISVYGIEYLYGAGITWADEKICERMTPHPLARKILLGQTEIPRSMFEEYLESISQEFSEDKYDLINFNCNNFTDTASEFLVGKGIPEEYINFVERIKMSPNGSKLLQMVLESDKRANEPCVPGMPRARKSYGKG